MLDETTKIKLHIGRVLIDHIAERYSRIIDIVYELFQNSIDAEAKLVVLDLDQRKKSRNLTVWDDGIGFDQRKASHIFSKVGQSVKKEGKYFGKHGIGFFASLGKCEEFVVISCAKGSTEYREWTFNTAEILATADNLAVRTRSRPDIIHVSDTRPLPRGVKEKVSWRTHVYVRNFTNDVKKSLLPTAEKLFEEIEQRFGQKMRENDVAISVRLIDEKGKPDTKTDKARKFTGQELPSLTLEDVKKKRGSVAFNMGLARKTQKGYEGKVVIGEMGNISRVTMDDFEQSHGRAVAKSALEMLTSGIFEGEILSQTAKIHPNRRSFVDDDHLLWLVEAMEQWCAKHGKKYFDEVRDDREDERLQKAGLESMRNIAEILKEFEPLFQPVLADIKKGTVGDEHAALAKSRIEGKQPEKSKSTEGEGGGGDNGHGSDKRGGQPRADHHPLTVTGPKGKRRTIVRDDSKGLQLAYMAMEIDEPYVFERQFGRLTINTLHPDWVNCEGDERKWKQYQELAWMVVLAREGFPADASICESQARDTLHLVAHLLRISSMFGAVRKGK